MFEQLQPAPPDAILGLTEAFRKDARPEKINLTVGVYKDASGQTPILRCVKEAEKRLLESESSKSYLGIDGIPEYGRLVRELLWGPQHEIVTSSRAVTLQTPGGTGALRVAGDFLHKLFPSAKIWCSQPTWANHPGVFKAAGLTVETYPYFDPERNSLKFDALIEALQQIPAGDVICLHACCHNPTGVDPTPEQWKQIADVVQERGILPLVDFAYQGFGVGFDEDAAGLRELSRPGMELIVASSFSKNFGLYCERVGALTVVAASAETAQTALSQLKICVRTNYSNPPYHGGGIVATVLQDAELRSTWEQEVATMRDRINGMRKLFADTMAQKTSARDFSFIKNQHGMFSQSGLTPEQVDRLREDYAIYIVRNGRINVAGMTEDNMERLCDAIASVL
ncbi:MAG: aspartate/tyrosine/aromatic aminotransferase [Planctomycetes bacterium]|nr:aspartate/tyrosine/aromatic aminotransferase [Planctomycetota bacterium]